MKRSKTTFYLSFLLLCANSLLGQIENLVNNGSFEDYYNCSYPNHGRLAKFWTNTDSLKFSGKYFNTCAGLNNVPSNPYTFQHPRHGNALIISTWYFNGVLRGYLRNRLKVALVAGKSYCVTYYVNIANTSPYGIDGFGAFAGGQVLDTITQCTIPLTYILPQVSNPKGNVITDTLKWVAISGSFVASGGEKYLFLGNFLADSAVSTATLNPKFLPAMWTDVCIDDVSLFELYTTNFAGTDTSIMQGDSIYIGGGRDFASDRACTWYDSANLSLPLDTAAGMWVKPAKTTTYVVRMDHPCNGVIWDSVVVYVGFVGINKRNERDYNLQITPNPSSGDFRLCGLIQGEEYSLKILDIGGRILYNRTFPASEECKNVSADIPKGVYQVVCNNGVEVFNQRLIIQSD